MAGPTKDPSLQDYPEFVAAEARRHELQTERAKVERELVALGEAQRAAGMSEVPRPSTAPRLSPVQREARGLTTVPLADGEVGPAGGLSVAALNVRGLVLHEACRIQGAAVDRLRAQYSHEIALKARPAYEKLVTQIAEAACALSRAEAKARAFLDDLAARGVTDTGVLTPMAVRGDPGSLRDEYSGVRRFLTECRERGFPAPAAPEGEAADRAAQAADERRRVQTHAAELASRETAKRRADMVTQAKRAAKRERRLQAEEAALANVTADGWHDPAPAA